MHVLAVVDHLMSRGIGFRSITEGLHTDGPMGTAMLTIMAAFAQLERDTMIERTRAGLAAAAANGPKGGRPRKVDDADTAKARSLRNKGVTASDIAKMLGVSRATVYRYLSDEPLPDRTIVRDVIAYSSQDSICESERDAVER